MHGRDTRAEGARSKSAPLPTARLDNSQRLACLRLIRSENVGPITFRALINHFGGAQAALDALPELSRRGGRRTIRICPRDAAEAELEAAERIGARPIFTIEPGYPAALAAIEAAPPLIYTRRRALWPAPLLRSWIAVGFRSGPAAHAELAAGLGEAGYVVVSGLALGMTQPLIARPGNGDDCGPGRRARHHLPPSEC